MTAHGRAFLCLAVSAAAAFGQITHTAAEWYGIIRAEVLDHYRSGRETSALHDIRVGMAAANLTFSHCELTDNTGAAAWSTFKNDLYDGILAKVLNNEGLTQDEEKYRPIVLGYYGITHESAVQTWGQAALFKGWKGEQMTRLEVDHLLMYRSSLISGGVGEANYLPWRWGHHPYMRPSSTPINGGLHYYSAIHQANIGKQFHDLKLRTFEATLESPLYFDDQIEPRDLWGGHFRMETQLDYLGIAAGYEPVTSGGTTKYLAKQSDLQLDPGEDPADFVRIADRVAQRPVLLWLNDPVDYPYQGTMGHWEYFHQAYRGLIDVYHIPSIIHDRCLGSTGKGPLQYSGGSYNSRPWQWPWSREEQARRMTQRFLELPFVSCPVLIDNEALAAKNAHGAIGGGNHMYLIDKDGVFCQYAMQMDLANLDSLERAMLRLLGKDGACTSPGLVSQGWVNFGFSNGDVLLCGWVRSVDGSRVRVKRLDENADSYHGYRIRRAYDDRGVAMQLSMRDADDRHAAVQAWAASPGKVYTFVLPSTITYDGRSGQPAGSLQAGDFIAVTYAGADENNSEITAGYARATGKARKEADDVTTAASPRRGPCLQRSAAHLGNVEFFSLTGARIGNPGLRAPGIVVGRVGAGSAFRNAAKPTVILNVSKGGGTFRASPGPF